MMTAMRSRWRTLAALLTAAVGAGHAQSRQLAAGFAAKLPAGGIADITQPVPVLNGDEDPIVRPAAGRMLARAMPRGRFVLVHRMGHMFSAPLCVRTGQRDRPARDLRRVPPVRYFIAGTAIPKGRPSHTWLDRGGLEGDLMELNGWASPQMLRRYGARARSARARRTYDRIMTDT